MASNYWAKLWIEMLDDPKAARLSDHLWRRFVEMILLGKERDEAGYLPSVADMAWRMRCSDESMLADLQALEAAGLLELREGQWYVVNFAKRQDAMPVAERVMRHRENKQKQTYYGDQTQGVIEYGNEDGNAPVTDRNIDQIRSEQITEAETEPEADAPPAPETRTITPGPEPQKPAPTLTPQEVDTYLATPDPVLLEKWPTLRQEMQGQVTRDMYDQWIAPLQPLVMRDHTAFFCHPTTFGQEWCTSRLKVMIDRTVRSIMPDSMGAAVLVGGIP